MHVAGYPAGVQMVAQLLPLGASHDVEMSHVIVAKHWMCAQGQVGQCGAVARADGAALRIGAAALADKAWAETTVQRLRSETAQADDLAQAAGWQLVGGCELFRTYETPDAETAQNRLADRQIWSRIFPYSNRWLRIGLPGSPAEWARLTRALEG
jgi:hypothetical protein